MSFGDRLQALRRSSGMTQEDFAQQLKVSRQAVSKWESSRGYPEIEKIIYICNHYGVTMDELFQDEVPSGQHTKVPESQPAAQQPMKALSLRASIGNFLANLSPHHQQFLGGVLALVLLALLILLGATISPKGETNLMTWKLIWLGLLVLFTAGEAITVGLTSIWFAAGALAGLICALLGGPLWLQITLFIVISFLCLLAIRPLAQKYFNNKVEPTNADRIIGSTARVTEDINNILGEGAVSIEGLTWTARSEHDDLIPTGTLVTVLRIEGVKVYVEKLKEDVKC